MLAYYWITMTEKRRNMQRLLIQRYRHAILSLLPQPVPCFMNTSFHLSPHLFFLFSLCSPSPLSHPALLHSFLAYFCVSLPLPHFVSLLSLNDSASPSVTPPLCSPSLSPSFPPHHFLPPADDAWCDEDWLRGSQGEENRRYVLQWWEGGGDSGGGGGDGGGKKNEEKMGTDNNVRDRKSVV